VRTVVETAMAKNERKQTKERAGSIGKAAKQVIRNDEYARMREAYRLQPDSADEADDWSSAEKFRL
jgi:hypothetical protein